MTTHKNNDAKARLSELLDQVLFDNHRLVARHEPSAALVSLDDLPHLNAVMIFHRTDYNDAPEQAITGWNNHAVDLDELLHEVYARREQNYN